VEIRVTKRGRVFHVVVRPSLGETTMRALLAAGGIGDLPPLVRADLMREGRLIEVMPEWRFPAQDLHHEFE
jgi:hypothetical protein